jgi:hypothetical protein
MLFARSATSHVTALFILGYALALCMQLHKLCCNEDVSTVTSMSVATLHVQRNGQALVDQRSSSNATAGAIAVVDYPGHERLRAGLKRQLASTAAVLCVIDTSDLANQVSVDTPCCFTTAKCLTQYLWTCLSVALRSHAAPTNQVKVLMQRFIVHRCYFGI